MQHEAVDAVRAEMLQRTGQRLCDLNCRLAPRIVGQTMVLPALVGEFRLQEKIGARNYSRAISGGESFADSGFEVMPPLVGSVDGAKPRAEGEFREGRGAVFFPGSTVNEVGEG